MLPNMFSNLPAMFYFYSSLFTILSPHSNRGLSKVNLIRPSSWFKPALNIKMKVLNIGHGVPPGLDTRSLRSLTIFYFNCSNVQAPFSSPHKNNLTPLIWSYICSTCTPVPLFIYWRMTNIQYTRRWLKKDRIPSYMEPILVQIIDVHLSPKRLK